MGWNKVFGHIPEPKYKIIELTRKDTEPVLNDELRASIASLKYHPGFEYLLARARAVKAYLKRQLEEGRHDDMRQVHYLQAGIYWANFWEREMLTKSQPVKPPAEPSDIEREAFEAAKAALEVVGLSDDSATSA